jgi:hypothetical protein
MIKFLLPLILFAQFAQASFAVIANSSISASSISKADLKSVFSANMASFGGAKVQVVMLPGTDPVAAAFFSSIGLSAPEFDRIWLEKALSGQANPPTKKATSADVISAVGASAGAMGIISAGDAGKVSGSAKVLTVN